MLTLRARPQRGVSLVELMVAIAIGMIVVLGAIQVYLTAARGGVTATRSNRLNQDLRAVLNVMMDDIRRAGHMSDPTALTSNPFTQATTDLAVAANCVRYSYDATWKGGSGNVVDPGTDFSGFRFFNNAVQFMVSTTNASTATCADTLGWENVTDPSVVRIASLSFDVVGSKCIAFDPATYQESDPTTYQSWTTTSGTTTACVAGSAGAPSPFPTGKSLVEVRTVRISLTAQHASDATLTATASDTVTLRNHRVFTN